MGKKITVIGGGTTGIGTAAMLTMAGHTVTLTDVPELSANLEGVKEKGGILVRGNGPRGLAMPACITTDVTAAVADADVILVSVIGPRHAEIAKLVAPAVRDGQVIGIAPGNAGSLIFADVFKKAGVTADVVLLEMQRNFFSSRLTAAGEVNAARGFVKGAAVAFPAKDTDKAFERMEGVLEFTKAKNIFETTINEANTLNHLSNSILNTSMIDQKKGKFALFIDGLTPSVLKGMEICYQEYKAVADAWGYKSKGDPVPHFAEIADLDNHRELDLFRSLAGPDTIKHRYISEDAQCSVSLLVSLGKKAGVKTPFNEAMIAIASGLNDTDYYGQGCTLENFGLADMTMEQIDHYLETGEK